MAEIFDISNRSDISGEYVDKLGFNSMGLSFKVITVALMDENIYYSIYFDRTVSQDDIKEIVKRISAELNSLSEDIIPGSIFDPRIEKNNMISVALDLGNANDECMLTGIVRSLNGMSGIEKIIINEWAIDFPI